MSPSPATHQDRGVKRKKPPTFQHLPIQRAKKLKQSWVEVQKVKSKWKAQKRKEGLIGSRTQLERAVDAAEDKPPESEEEEGDDRDMPSTSDAGEGSQENEEESGEESGDEKSERSSVKESPPKHTLTKTNLQKTTAEKKPTEQPSLRDLQAKAYSRSSLHKHTAGPSHPHKGAAIPRGRGRGRGGGSGRGSRGGDQRGRGRGQPDMGLRMKAMLEKIKKDFS